MRLQAIYKLYPQVESTDKNETQAFSKNGVEVLLDEVLIKAEIEKLETFIPKNVFYKNRALIMDSIGWIHERIQSQTVIIQGGYAITAKYTVAQAIEYYLYKQELRDRPSIITDWTSISYPVVPQHVYDAMEKEIKALCQELQCDPVV